MWVNGDDGALSNLKFGFLRLSINGDNFAVQTPTCHDFVPGFKRSDHIPQRLELTLLPPKTAVNQKPSKDDDKNHHKRIDVHMFPLRRRKPTAAGW